jgi:ABC-type spermidine/putrescine transport system permease subunit I
MKRERYSAEQTRKQSIIESLTNVFSGMLIAFIISQLAAHFETGIQQYIWAGFNWKVSAGSNVIMTVVLTVVSILRGYAWRRHFNRRTQNEVTEKRI